MRQNMSIWMLDLDSSCIPLVNTVPHGGRIERLWEHSAGRQGIIFYRAMQNPLWDVLNLSRSSQWNWEISAVCAVESGCFLFKFSQLFMMMYCAPDRFNNTRRSNKYLATKHLCTNKTNRDAVSKWVIIIIIIMMYIYHALINALSAHIIHINLNMIFYTHIEHSPTKTIYIKYYTKKKCTINTRTHTDCSRNWVLILVRTEILWEEEGSLCVCACMLVYTLVYATHDLLSHTQENKS